MTGMFHGTANLFKSFNRYNQNCKLLFTVTVLNGFSQGIFMVVFNLYILSLGITPDVLGGILSAGPFAQALGSIPMGFLMETIGFKKVFLIIYGVSGIAKLVQVASAFVPLISGAAFVSGLALAGDFVVRLPFLAANTEPEQRTQVYSMSAILNSISMALGSLFAGYAPTLVQHLFGIDMTVTYRYTLFLAGMLSLIAVLPALKITDSPRTHTRKISLAPYLWHMDRFTVQQAVVSLFVGVSLGLTNPFMNMYFIYHLGTTREFFGTVSALSIIPALIATAIGPILAVAWGSVRIVTYLRSAIPVFMINLAITTNPWLGTISNWLMNSFSTTAQPISFSFAMQAAKPSAKPAASAWLNVTFWLGNAMAAPLAGAFLVKSNYRAPLLIAAGSILLAGIFNEVFFNRIEVSLKREEIQKRRVEAEAS
jgi:MFS family permease